MAKIFQIIFTVLAVLCIAAALPVGGFVGWIYCIILFLAGAAFAVAMLLVKGGNPFRKQKPKPGGENATEEEHGKSENEK